MGRWEDGHAYSPPCIHNAHLKEETYVKRQLSLGCPSPFPPLKHASNESIICNLLCWGKVTLTQQDTTNATQVSTILRVTGKLLMIQDTHLRIRISNLPILVVIEDRRLPLRPLCISTIRIRWQLGSGITGHIILILLCESIFAPFLIVRQRWVGEPISRGVVGGLGQALTM